MQTTEEKPITNIQYLAGSVLLLGVCAIFCSITTAARLICSIEAIARRMRRKR
jgi:hypothetical protein